MKDHLPIEKLPEYLKSLKDNDSFGSGVLVDMGQIASPKKSWLRSSTYVAALILFVCLGGLTTYNFLSIQNITLVIDAHNADLATVSKIISDSGSNVVSVKQNDDLTYEVKLSTRRNLNSLIDWLRKNKNFNKVEIDN